MILLTEGKKDRIMLRMNAKQMTLDTFEKCDTCGYHKTSHQDALVGISADHMRKQRVNPLFRSLSSACSSNSFRILSLPFFYYSQSRIVSISCLSSISNCSHLLLFVTFAPVFCNHSKFALSKLSSAIPLSLSRNHACLFKIVFSYHSQIEYVRFQGCQKSLSKIQGDRLQKSQFSHARKPVAKQ